MTNKEEVTPVEVEECEDFRLSELEIECLRNVIHALGVGKFRHKSLDDPEARRDLKEYLWVNLCDAMNDGRKSGQEWIDNNPGWVDSFLDFVASKSGQVTEE